MHRRQHRRLAWRKEDDVDEQAEAGAEFAQWLSVQEAIRLWCKWHPTAPVPDWLLAELTRARDAYYAARRKEP